MTAVQANQVIEALKDWCARAGFEVPETSGDGGAEAKRSLIRALWRRLRDAGAIRVQSDDALWRYLDNACGQPRRAGIDDLDVRQLDVAVERLGEWWRKTSAQERDGNEAQD